MMMMILLRKRIISESVERRWHRWLLDITRIASCDHPWLPSLLPGSFIESRRLHYFSRDSLKERQRRHRATVMYRIVHNLVAILSALVLRHLNARDAGDRGEKLARHREQGFSNGGARPYVCLSVSSIDSSSGGFAAERPAPSRYRHYCYRCHYYAAFNAPRVDHKDDESQAQMTDIWLPNYAELCVFTRTV